jgi:hypothetical protein
MGPPSYLGSVVDRNVFMRRILVNLSMLKALNYCLCSWWMTLTTAKNKQFGSRGYASDLYSGSARFTFRSLHGLVLFVHFWTSTMNGQLWSSEHTESLTLKSKESLYWISSKLKSNCRIAALLIQCLVTIWLWTYAKLFTLTHFISLCVITLKKYNLIFH